MRKVVTPSRQEVQTTTIVVIFTVFAFAFYFYAVDQILGRIIQALLHWLGVRVSSAALARQFKHPVHGLTYSEAGIDRN